MRAVNVRARLAEQQRLLGTMEWPRWALHGIPAVVVTIGAVSIWEHTTHARHSPDPPDSAVPAALLIALSVVPWVFDWVRSMLWPNRDDCGTGLAFAAAVLAPLAVVHLGGSWLGIADASVGAPQVSLMILLVMGCVVASCASAPVVLAVEVAVFAIIVGRALQSDELGTWVIWLIAAVITGCGGLAMRAIFISMQRLEALQGELARRAVADERRRVAREVHDTVAHTLSVTMLHLTAARLAVERAPDRAHDALLEAERQGRAGMTDLRRMVHLLRTDDDRDPATDESSGQAAGNGYADPRSRPGSPPAAGAFERTDADHRRDHLDDSGPPWPPPSRLPAVEPALPTIAELPVLIDSYAAAGLAITVEGDDSAGDGPRSGEPGADPTTGRIPPAVGLALYRVVQESLTNAARHGCGDARIHVVVDTEEAVLTVRNRCLGRPGREQADGGMGLVGMRERVVGLGGRFSAGPVIHHGTDDGNDTRDRTAVDDGSRTGTVGADVTVGGASPVTTWLVEAHLPVGPTA